MTARPCVAGVLGARVVVVTERASGRALPRVRVADVVGARVAVVAQLGRGDAVSGLGVAGVLGARVTVVADRGRALTGTDRAGVIVRADVAVVASRTIAQRGERALAGLRVARRLLAWPLRSRASDDRGRVDLAGAVDAGLSAVAQVRVVPSGAVRVRGARAGAGYAGAGSGRARVLGRARVPVRAGGAVLRQRDGALAGRWIAGGLSARTVPRAVAGDQAVRIHHAATGLAAQGPIAGVVVVQRGAVRVADARALRRGARARPFHAGVVRGAWVTVVTGQRVLHRDAAGVAIARVVRARVPVVTIDRCGLSAVPRHAHGVLGARIAILARHRVLRRTDHAHVRLGVARRDLAALQPSQEPHAVGARVAGGRVAPPRVRWCVHGVGRPPGDADVFVVGWPRDLRRLRAGPESEEEERGGERSGATSHDASRGTAGRHVSTHRRLVRGLPREQGGEGAPLQGAGRADRSLISGDMDDVTCHASVSRAACAFRTPDVGGGQLHAVVPSEAQRGPTSRPGSAEPMGVARGQVRRLAGLHRLRPRPASSAEGREVAVGVGLRLLLPGQVEGGAPTERDHGRLHGRTGERGQANANVQSDESEAAMVLFRGAITARPVRRRRTPPG